MNQFVKKLALAGALAGGLAAMSAPGLAQAKELRIVFGQAGDTGLTDGTKAFAAGIEERTDGRYTGKVFIGSLLNYAETMTGIRDGIADAGFVIPAYHRAEFPASNLMVDMATIGTDPVALAGAASEYAFSCQPCIDEFLAQNQILMGFSVIGPYYLMTKPRVTSMDDMKGLTIRGFSSFGRWVEAMGAKAVVLSANDIYEAMNQGQLDGNTHTPDVLKSLSIGEVANYLLNEPIGVYMGNSLYNLNRDVWNELSDEDKRNFLLAAGSAHGVSTVNYLADNKAILENPESAGVELLQPTDPMKAASAEFRRKDLATVAKLNEEKFGMKNAAAEVERFKALVDKWRELVKTVDKTDPKAVGDLYNREVFSKVDLAIFE
jgi:TRAP-type C4-dicarboxylate transport system substrate-binding protein